MTINKYEFDFIIIGSGLAGLYSAMYASNFGKVAVITKSSIDESSSYWAQGGIAAVMDSGDSIEDHFTDTINAGQGLCNEKNVKILVSEGKERIQELINLGMQFDSSDNQLLLGLEGGHSKRRILHAGGSETGKKVVQFVIGEISSNENIHVFENTFAFELIKNGNSCIGVRAFNWKQKQTYNFIAPATILASGGLSGIFARSTNPHVSTGDGIALAYFASAELSDLEFIQFHPTAFYSESGETFLVSEAVRGEGALLLNDDLKRFMPSIDPRAELAPRDIVSKAIYEQIKEQNNKYVYLDARKIDENYFKKRFPNIYSNALKLGFELPNDLLPIAPAAHYTIGGVKTDSVSRTNVNGLYACGETAATGIHGANRLASNSLLECLVFGKRAVKSAIDDKSDLHGISIDDREFSVDASAEENYIIIRNRVSNLLNESAGIIRSGNSISSAVESISNMYEVQAINNYEYYSFRTKLLLTLSELILKFAQVREESRGCHSRKDFINKEEDFKGNFLISNDGKPVFNKS